jgi:hypothetical protein
MKRILLFIALIVFSLQGFSQISVSPNSACPGQTITVTITGVNYNTASSGCGGVIANVSGITNGATLSIPATSVGSPNYQAPTTLTLTIPANFTPGSYGFRTNSNCGNAGTCSSCFTVNPLPTAAITGNNTICPGASTTLTASGGTSYAWSSGQNTAAITVSPASTTTYTVTVTNASGCTATATRTVTINTLPTAAVTGTNTICPGASTTLTASGGTSYAWSSGQNTAAITVSPASATTYTVTVTGANGCTATASRTVTLNSVPNAQIIGGTEVCAGGSTTLFASGGTSYLWSTGAATSSTSVTPAQTTTYTVTVTGANTCTSSTTHTVTVNALPTAQVNGPSTICSGLSATLTASGGTSYLWNTTDATAAITVTPANTTTYTVTVTDANSCSAIASQTVTVANNPTASITGNTAICAGSPTTLTANGGNTYTWGGGETTSAITVSPAATTTYSVTVSVGANCTASTNITVNVTPMPAISGGITGPATLCDGDTVQYSVASDANTDSYSWTFPLSWDLSLTGTTNQVDVIAGITGGSVSVTPVSLQCGPGSAVQTVVTAETVPATPTLTAVGPVITSSSNLADQTWYLNGVEIQGATGQTFTATVTGDYTVAATNNCGTSSISVSLNVVVIGLPGITETNVRCYPNPVTDELVITNNGTKAAVIELYDLNGTFISTVTVAKTGYIDMSNLPAGIYSLKVTNGATSGVQKIVKQ